MRFPKTRTPKPKKPKGEAHDAQPKPAELPPYSESMFQNKSLYMKYAREFEQTFGIKLINYWNHLTGFDAIKFDDHVKPRKNESTCDAVKRKWGVEAVVLAMRVLRFPPDKIDEFRRTGKLK